MTKLTATVRNRIGQTLSSSVLITCAAVASYWPTFSNGFLGDDNAQILNNPLVESLSNVTKFFGGSSFYIAGGTSHQFVGTYYKPLQTLSYALLYSIGGANATPYHAFQLLIHALNGILLYLVLRRWFRPTWSLTLGLLFVVYPVNSQAVYSIASLQDVLFFFFGMAAIWLLGKNMTTLSLVPCTLLILLSLLSKETGVLFVPVSLAYLWWFDRDRLVRLGGLLGISLLIYLALRLNAVGLVGNPNNAPIDKISLGGRLLNLPSLLMFYLVKMVWPFGLSSSYYWVHSSFTLNDTVLPFLVDFFAFGLWLAGLFFIRRRGTPHHVRSYLFFSLWCGFGLLAHLQIIALDMTAADQWLYFPLVGFYGAVGVGVAASVSGFAARLPTTKAAPIVVVGLLLLSGTLTAMRGPDWHDIGRLTAHDIQVQPNNYVLNRLYAQKLDLDGAPDRALPYALKSINEFPSGDGYDDLGLIYYDLHQYSQSATAYLHALDYFNTVKNYEGVARALAVSGSNRDSVNFVQGALRRYPTSSFLWEYLATLQYHLGDTSDARASITQAYSLSHSDEIVQVYQIILSGQPLNVTG